jgi:hypothetical protein
MARRATCGIPEVRDSTFGGPNLGHEAKLF